MAQLVKGRIFATGTAGESKPDSITIGDGSIWVEYGNGADSTGAGGSSTIVRYSMSGKVQHKFTIKGSVDGLKIDPATGTVYALQNQDGNSTLSLIDPKTNKVTGPISYAVSNTGRGYDDIAFDHGSVYVSYTNPNGSGDAVVQKLVNGTVTTGTLVTTDILADGAMGTNIATGAVEAIPLSDPDSLKSLANGSLVLTSGGDNTFTIIADPGTKAQSERFVTLKNLPTGSSLDDVVIPTASSGTFYVTNTGTNQVEAFTLSGLNTSDAYASVGTEIVQVDLQTGAQTVVVSGLSASHGLAFVASAVKVPTVQSTSIFAVGSEANATAPDSVTTARDGSIWVEYGNHADSTGTLPVQGSSTIVQYDKLGNVVRTYTLPGSIDGLKSDPVSGLIFALKNQDANSYLYTINPKTGHITGPLAYGGGYVYGTNSQRGHDDVAFLNGKVVIDVTNPTHVGDAVLQILNNGNNPHGTLNTSTILRLGDTGTNLVTHEVNQLLPIADPDSLKTLADGTLVMTSDHDQSLTFIKHAGQANQTESFINLPAGSSGLDDAIIPTSSAGTFYISNAGANDVLKVKVTGLNTKDVYLSVGSDNAIDQLDLTTGTLTPVIVGLNSPHGFVFIPDAVKTQTAAVGKTVNLDHEATKAAAFADTKMDVHMAIGSTSAKLEPASGGAYVELLYPAVAPLGLIHRS